MAVQLPWVVRLWETMQRPGLDVEGVVEGEPAEDVQVVLPLGRVAPQRAADQGVDAVGADEDVVLLGACRRRS